MDRLSNLKYTKGSRKKRKRIGRGEGSGHGGTATKGMNGELSRSGSNHKYWFEGGQMPLQRRIPKFGFKNPFRVVNQVINISVLQNLIDQKKITNNFIDKKVLYENGLISSLKKPVKILGECEIKSKLILEIDAISSSAKQKIEAVGGTIKLYKNY